MTPEYAERMLGAERIWYLKRLLKQFKMEEAKMKAK